MTSSNSNGGPRHSLPWSALTLRAFDFGSTLRNEPERSIVVTALSGLDVSPEALRLALSGATGIVVAHRLYTVLFADRVVLLEPDDSVGATITHVGTHEELFARVQRYRQLLVADHEMDYLATYFTI